MTPREGRGLWAEGAGGWQGCREWHQPSSGWLTATAKGAPASGRTRREVQPPMSSGTAREGCPGAPCLTQGQRPLMQIILGDTQIIPRNIPLRALHCLKPFTSPGSPRGAGHRWARGCPCLQPGMGAAGQGHHSPKCPCEPGHLLQGQGCRGWGLSSPRAPAGPGPPHGPCCWRGWGLSPPRAPAGPGLKGLGSQPTTGSCSTGVPWALGSRRNSCHGQSPSHNHTIVP